MVCGKTLWFDRLCCSSGATHHTTPKKKIKNGKEEREREKEGEKGARRM